MEQHVRGPNLSESINADGFRRWHEYQLTRSFGYLALGLVALVAALSIMEGLFDAASIAGKLTKAFASFFALCFAAWAWRQFIDILIFAEGLSKQAFCASCGRYAQLTVVRERSGESVGARVLTCRCKKCQSEWDMGFTPGSAHD